MHLKSSLSPVIAFFLLLAGWVQGQELWVTGQPASTPFLRSLTQELGWDAAPTSPLEPGQVWEGPAGERVINLHWKAPDTTLTALSDHPEKITRRGGLFFGGLTNLRPLNLQYYHLSQLDGEDPEMILLVHNPSSEKALLHLSRASGEPSLDYFSTGHGNNVEWFKKKIRHEGYFAELPPGESRVLWTQPLPPEHVVSGNIKMTLLEGEPLQFALVARSEPNEPISLNNLLDEEDVHSRGFYPLPLQVAERTYSVGDEPLNIAVGSLRQQTFSGVKELRGDYGVEYEVRIRIKNPTSEQRRVQLLFNPRGGAATATMVIDEQIVEVPLTEAFAEVPFWSVSIAPDSEKYILLNTIPEGASSYPVRIKVEETK